ncbi:Zinc finger BED domain-containing protein [Melia azedarach]|nr:Zinc finger BED domain-containing protein [Melia azedarach]
MDDDDEVEALQPHDQNKEDEMVNQDVKYSSIGDKQSGRKLKTKTIPGKRLKSKVWQVFTKYTGEDGNVWAVCNYCNHKFDGSSKKGTTHLKNHSERCRGKKRVGRGADSSTQFASKEKSVIDLINPSFDARGTITEQWNPSILNSRKVDILQVYKEGKEKLCTFLSQLSCRLSLTIQQFGSWYLFMVDYIDDRWQPKRRIINIEDATVGFPRFTQILECLCLDWKISNNICFIVSMDDHILIEEMNVRVGSLPFGEHLFHFDGLLDILQNFFAKVYHESDVVDDIEIPLNKQNFQISPINEALSMGKKVASQHFSSRGFTEVLPWDEASLTYKNFKELRDLVCSWSGSKYTTPNVLFPKFCDLHMKFLQWERSENYSIGQKASAERRQFDLMKKKYLAKYWERSKLVLVIAVVLDPRFKKDILQLWYKEIYGSDADEYFNKTFDEVTFVYNKYAKDSIDGNAKSSTTYKMLDSMGRPRTSSQAGDIASPTSELDRYLRDDKFPPVEEFDILSWWRVNVPMYPTLARMARDFLAVPISSRRVTSDSVLGRNLEKVVDCEALDYDIKLPLVCMKTWFTKPLE